MGLEALSAGWQRIQLYIYLRDHRSQVILIVDDNNKNSKLEQ